jgi:hypothetical protein
MKQQSRQLAQKKHTHKKHTHIFDIPKKFLPKNTKAREYMSEMKRVAESLRYTNQKAQYSAQICVFDIRSINRNRGYHPSPRETFRMIEEFVYHYENFCFRSFSYREKMIQFINAALPVGYDESEVSIRQILINPTVREAKILPIVTRFKDDRRLGQVINDRNCLTHKLYYGISFDRFFRPKIADHHEMEKGGKERFRKWCIQWEKEIMRRAKSIDTFSREVFKIDNELAVKIIRFKESK